MNPRTTWILVAAAFGLLAFILFVEQHLQSTSRVPQSRPHLLSLNASAVTNIQLRVTNQLVVRAEKTNGNWHLTLPIAYPAQSERIDHLLELLENLDSQKLISLAELNAEKRSLADFGLDVPQLALTIYHDGQRSEILFGSKTALGDQSYVQMLASPDVYVISSELFDRIPREADDWRDPSLLQLADLNLDRLEVRAPGRGFALVLDATNKTFYLSKPTPARADVPKVEALLRSIAQGRILSFVEDGPILDVEPYGLQPPVAELVLGKGTNDLVTVQFGKSPTNNAQQVYARQLGRETVVLVSRSLLDVLLTTHTELRDRHLLTFDPNSVDRIEMKGVEGFAVYRQTNNTWIAAGAQPLPVDTDLVRDWLDRLSRLQGTVEKDVVTDYTPYGLVDPARQVLLQEHVKLPNGQTTNHTLAQLDIGARQDDKIFVRRPDENSAYSVPVGSLDALPKAPWQLRDRRVFHFKTNEIASVTIRNNGYERKLLRSANANWSLAPGSQGMINTFAVEDMMDRLGELSANAWLDRGPGSRERNGFASDGYRLTIELREGEQMKTVVLEFSKRAPSPAPVALTLIDDQPWVFEFPAVLFYNLIRYLNNPPKSPGPKQ